MQRRIQIPENAEEHLFDFPSVGFLFDKKGKKWRELGESSAEFSFDKDSSSIIVKSGKEIFHRVSVTTKVQNQVSSTQSWVFRAVHCLTGSHDVVCLQIPEDPKAFVEKYEKNRMKCLQLLEPTAKPLNREGSSTSASSDEDIIGSNLSRGLKALSLDSTSKFSPEQTGGMRRRLSTVGMDPTIDGYAPGARHEQGIVTSPTQKSPLRPNISGAAKTLRPKKNVPTAMTFSGVSIKGYAPYNPDKQNQDSLLMHQLPGGEILLSVFDGHGIEGGTVSNHFKNRIPKLLSSSASFSNSQSTGVAIKEALLKAEREIVDNVHVDTTLSGTTGVIAVVRGTKLFVANVGDSRAVFGMSDENADASQSGKYIARDATIDHKPDHPEEKKRIQEIGGRVFAVKFDDGIDGPPRVWLSYADLPGLAMSRSLCDTIAKEAGVISDADLFEIDLTQSHKFLIIATDGLWEFMSSQEVVNIVSKYANSVAPDAEAAIKELVEESNKKWRANEPVIDDTSIILAFFA